MLSYNNVTTECHEWLDCRARYLKEKAMGLAPQPLEYGDVVYTTPKIYFNSSKQDHYRRLQVMKYHNEYNVFLEQRIGGIAEMQYAGSYKWESQAIELALETALILSGRIRSRKS